jgi:hypothetical protein
MAWEGCVRSEGVVLSGSSELAKTKGGMERTNRLLARSSSFLLLPRLSSAPAAPLSFRPTHCLC